jgi:hypothetical protein
LKGQDKLLEVKKLNSRNNSREDNLSDDHQLQKSCQKNNNQHIDDHDNDSDNDDPLYREDEKIDNKTNIRRAGISQSRDGRAFLSRKNSFNSKKEAQDENKMSKNGLDDIPIIEKQLKSLEKSDSNEVRRPRPGSASVQRSTSRVKQIAQSLHERETTVRKTEAMIANHQPIADSLSEKRDSDIGSIGPSSPLRQRANINKQINSTKAGDDSFIKELLEIARAESQEKQKTEITFTPNLLKSMSGSNKSMNLQDHDTNKKSLSRSNSLKIKNDSNSNIFQSCNNVDNTFHNSSINKKDYESSNENLLNNKRVNSLREDSPLFDDDVTCNKPKDFKEAISMASTRLTRKKNSKDCSLERGLDSTNDSNNNTPRGSFNKGRVLPDNYTGSNSDLLNNNDNLIHEISDSNIRKMSRDGNRLKREELPYSIVPPNRRRSKLSSLDYRSKDEKNVEIEESSSGIYSNNTNPDDDIEYNDNVRNQKEYYNNLINKVKNLKQSKYNTNNNNNSNISYNNQILNQQQSEIKMGNTNKIINSMSSTTKSKPPLGLSHTGSMKIPMNRSPNRSTSPVKKSQSIRVTSLSNNSSANNDDPNSQGKRIIVKKKKIIRKVRTSVDNDNNTTRNSKATL